MSKQIKAFSAAILGTTAMTAFSYLFSYLSKDNTKEPTLLGKMIRRLFPGISRKHSRTSGWIVHYAVGVLFAELYSRVWEQRTPRETIKTGLIFGGLSGIAAILIWKFTMETHPFSPRIDFTTFALNLLLAHVVFGLFAAIGYIAAPPGKKR